MKWLICLLLTSCAVPSKTEGFCLPKRITPMLGAIFLLGFAATSSSQELIQEPLAVHCKEVNGTMLCLMKEQELDDLIAKNNQAWIQLAQALKRIAELEKQGPRCAQLEVLPKPPIPPIKPERKS